MSMESHGKSRLNCVCKCSTGLRSADKPAIHILAGGERMHPRYNPGTALVRIGIRTQLVNLIWRRDDGLKHHLIRDGLIIVQPFSDQTGMSLQLSAASRVRTNADFRLRTRTGRSLFQSRINPSLSLSIKALSLYEHESCANQRLNSIADKPKGALTSIPFNCDTTNLYVQRFLLHCTMIRLSFQSIFFLFPMLHVKQISTILLQFVQ